MPPKVEAKLSTADIIAKFCMDAADPDAGGPVQAEDAAKGYAAYLRYVTRGFYREAPHTRLLCSKLEAVERGEVKRLMIFMPPRHSKSETTSKHFPGYFVGKNQQRRVILGSYGDDLARDFGRQNRDDLEEYGKEIFGLAVSHKSAAANRWDLAGKRGGMVTAGVGGPLTGRGAHLLIIDDPFKDWEEAQSPTIREKVWNWYRSVAYTRLQKDGAVILIQTRWHEDDLAGRLLTEMASGGEQWEIVNLPAEAEENDLLGRKPGEPLWPEGGFDYEWMARTKRAVGPYVWAALFQQRPQPMGGGIFKRDYFRYFEEQGEFFVLHTHTGDEHVRKCDCLAVQFVDAAQKAKEQNDYFVATTWAYTPKKDALLLDVFRTKLEGPDQPPYMRDLYRRFKPARVGIEDKSAGSTLIQTLKREGLPIKEIQVDTDKVTRAVPAGARYSGGTVYHRLGAPWLEAWEAEHIAFPNGANDDQVDNSSMMAADIADLDASGILEHMKSKVTQCRACGKTVAKTATKCHHCGVALSSCEKCGSLHIASQPCGACASAGGAGT